MINSLAAEGCPQLALQLARHWQQQGVLVHVLCLQSEPNDLRPEFNALAIPIHTEALSAGLPRFSHLASLSYKLCCQLRPQAVLSFPLGWHAFIAIGARAAGVKRVCAHVGNLPPVWAGNAFNKFRLLVQLGRPFTHRLLCCSEYVRAATVRDFALSRQETRAIFNACDLERFVCMSRSTRPELQPGSLPRLAMVARLEPHKDQPTLIRAAALLRDHGLPLQVWLIGEGSCRAQLEALIVDLHLQNQVQVLGSRRDIPELLAQLDLFVFAARPDEGFGIALAEAMAAGVPIVATDVGACREVLDAGRCGLLVESGSPEALAAGIRQVLSDPASAQDRATAARQRAQRHFSVAAMAQAYGLELGLP
ncbi:glycosyltransferase [Synechococcus sp. CBW1107]|uniref:glycosyltransferase n=1 Tax=Synechococcus sp. CBW1107 TaxID=2789857 RepID=UPI002AD55C99|nr:glycosyltransferase [Synechococcus sp. CBW1107]